MARPGRLAVLLLAMMFAAALVTAQSEPVETQQDGMTYISTGVWNRDVTLSQSKSPYVINGPLKLNAGYTLTIEPGVRVEWTGPHKVTIEGRVDARGTADSLITFMRTDNLAEPPDFYLLTLNATGSGSIFEWTNFTSLSGSLYQGGITSSQNGLTVRNAAFNKVQRAISLWASDGVTIEDSSFTRNMRWDLAIANSTRVYVRDNTFVSGGGWISVYGRSEADVVIERNSFTPPGGSSAIGVQYGQDSSGVTIRNNCFKATGNGIFLQSPNVASYPEILGNSFLGTTRTAIQISSINAPGESFSATENYWGTTDAQVIQGMILDGNDYSNMPKVVVDPILTAPDANTPACATASCTNECSQSGTKTCSGTGYKTCGSYDSDSCVEWSTVTACAAGEQCTGGVCVTNVTCTDECDSGALTCSGSGFTTCGNYDSDACLEWAAVTACASGEQCANGFCSVSPPPVVPPPPPPAPVPNATCADDCVSGVLVCSGSGVIFCGNFDDDTCLEWSVTAPCAEGQVCDAGVCVTPPPPDIRPCVDDCAPGPKVCWRNGFRGCANFDDDPCLEWSEVTNCPRDQRCANGVCAPLPPPEERCVTICHLTSSHPESICVAPDALQAHHDHGDYLGECVQPDEKERDREIRNIIERLEARRPKEIPILRPDMPIEKITIEVDEEFTRVEFVFRNTERPPKDVPAPERKVRRYIEIEHPEIGNEKVTSAKLDFKVERTWLQEQGASLGDVVLTRFKDGAWQDLPTRNVRSDANYEYFEADSVGLSVFAITVRAQEPTAEPAQEIPVQPPVSLLSLTSQTSLIGIAAFVLAGGALGAMLLSRMQRRAPKKAAGAARSPALAQYVQSCREKGFSEERIRDTLLRAGWDAGKVREACSAKSAWHHGRKGTLRWPDAGKVL